MKKRLGVVLKIIGNVLLYALLVFCLFAVIVATVSKKSTDGAATVFGYQLRIVRSDSMEESEFTDVSKFEIKSLPVKTLLFIECVPTDGEEAEKWYGDLREGDVLTFRYVYTSQETITHRITKIEKKELGGYIFYLQGDNKSGEYSTLTQRIDTSDVESPNYVLGKVTGQSFLLGLLLYALKTPVGIVCIVILPCLIVIGLEIARIVSVLNSDKKEKERAERESRLNEIEELKKQLELLKKSGAGEDKEAEETEETEG